MIHVDALKNPSLSSSVCCCCCCWRRDMASQTLMRIAMSATSTLILAYYVFTLPMSFYNAAPPQLDNTNDNSSSINNSYNNSNSISIIIAAPPVSVEVSTSSLDLKKTEIPLAPSVEEEDVRATDSKKDATVDDSKQNSPVATQESYVVAVEDVVDVDERNVVGGGVGGDGNGDGDSAEPVQIVDDGDVESEKESSEKEEESEYLGKEVFHSLGIFKRNYEEMENKLKVYIYPDGDANTYFHTPRKLTGKYASEGYFFKNLRDSKFVTHNPEEAHLFFLPISCHKMRGKGISYEKMAVILEEYVVGLMRKYPYWNRTLGADHLFATCHDVGARATNNVAHLVKNSIRVVCSPSYNSDFIPHKDVAMPQVLQPFALPRGGGSDVRNRTILGFWAGHRNSKIRVVLAKLWENDDVLAISNNRISRAIGEMVYQKQFYRSKFCICPAGSQVNSARIADSIHYGCIPDFYELPFSDVLDWSKFSIVLRERDVYQLKSKLQSISQHQFMALHAGLLQVQDRFEWHTPAVRYDAFHMVMYELWLRHFTVHYK